MVVPHRPTTNMQMALRTVMAMLTPMLTMMRCLILKSRKGRLLLVVVCFPSRR